MKGLEPKQYTNYLYNKDSKMFYYNPLNTRNSIGKLVKNRLHSKKYRRRLNTNILLFSDRSILIFKSVYDSLSDQELEQELINNNFIDKYKKSYSIDPNSAFS